MGGGSTANAVLLGIIVAILAATRFAGATGRWASWISALVGIWMVVSPWVYGYAGESWMWNSVVVGIIVLVLGIRSASAGSAGRPTAAAR